MATNESLVHASQTLQFTGGNAADTETVTIAGKVYTFQATLTDSDGNVHVGADAEGSIDNLVAAINLSDEGESATSAGTDYAASMTRNPAVYAEKVDADTLRVTAAVPGEIGNEISVSDTLAAAGNDWDGATLAGGSGILLTWLEELLAFNQLNSEVIFEIRSLTPAAD